MLKSDSAWDRWELFVDMRWEISVENWVVFGSRSMAAAWATSWGLVDDAMVVWMVGYVAAGFFVGIGIRERESEWRFF